MHAKMQWESVNGPCLWNVAEKFQSRKVYHCRAFNRTGSPLTATTPQLSLFQVYIGRKPAYSNLMTYLAALLDYFALEGARGAVVRAFFCRARGPGFSPTSF